ncbi:hypothetical protein VTN00DRAFT_9627 [Thermoascus crustaceus]|uniref:uncharacterized protein n=1 Tax=Thermoascus crustaceus TaxID=5088 RepID=UPI003743DEEE
MGIAESRILAENVLAACQRAESQGKSRLNDRELWSNQTIVKAAKNICKQIPPHIRGPRRQSAIRDAIECSPKIAIPDAVRDLQNKHERLFVQEEGVDHGDPNIHIQSTSLRISRDCSLAECYALVVRIQKQQNLHNIRLRLLYIAFYRLKQAIQPRGLWNDTSYFLAQTIKHSSKVDDTLENIWNNIKIWIDRGERYTLLAKDLGGLGALLILPDNIKESVWNKELPKNAKHENRIALIESLRRQGISEKAEREGLHFIAEDEFTAIWNLIEQSVDKEVNRALSQMNFSNDYRRSPTSTGDRQPDFAHSHEQQNEQSSNLRSHHNCGGQGNYLTPRVTEAEAEGASEGGQPDPRVTQGLDVAAVFSHSRSNSADTQTRLNVANRMETENESEPAYGAGSQIGVLKWKMERTRHQGNHFCHRNSTTWWSVQE